jgi:sec-independent protein translocase protein TatB
MTPRAALTKHLLDGDDSFLTGNFEDRPVRPVNGAPAKPVEPAAPEPRASGPAPFDTDAT